MGIGKFFLYAYSRPFEDIKKVGSLLKDVASGGESEESLLKPEGFEDAIKKRAEMVRTQLPSIAQKIQSRMKLIMIVAAVAGLWGLINLFTFIVDLSIFFGGSGGTLPYSPVVYVGICTALLFGCMKWLSAEREELIETQRQMKSTDKQLLSWVGDLKSTYKSMLFFKRVLLSGILIVSCYLIASLVNMNLMDVVVCVSIIFFMACMNIRYSLYLFQMREKQLAPLSDYFSRGGIADFFNPEL